MEKQNRKILLVSQHFYPEAFVINPLCQEMARLGVDVEVLTGQPNYPNGKIYDGYKATSIRIDHFNENIKVNRVPMLPRGNASKYRLILNYLSFILSATFIGTWLVRKSTFDAIFVYATSPIFQAFAAIVIKYIFRKKLVIWVQDIWPDVLQGTGTVTNPHILKIVGYMVNWVYRQSDLLVVQSEAFIEDVSARAPSKKVIYIPNPALPLAQGREYDKISTKDDFTVLFAGNVGRAQNFDTVLEAATILKPYKEIKIVVAGSGVDRERVMAIAKKQSLNISFIGQVGHDQIASVLAQADCLLVSLVASPIVSKTVPSKIPTYMAAGKPIIGSLNGAGAEIIKDAQSGLVSEAGNAELLAENILCLYNDVDGQREIFGTKSYEYFEKHFEISAVATKFQNILEEDLALPK